MESFSGVGVITRGTGSSSSADSKEKQCENGAFDMKVGGRMMIAPPVVQPMVTPPSPGNRTRTSARDISPSKAKQAWDNLRCLADAVVVVTPPNSCSREFQTKKRHFTPRPPTHYRPSGDSRNAFHSKQVQRTAPFMPTRDPRYNADSNGYYDTKNNRTPGTRPKFPSTLHTHKSDIFRQKSIRLPFHPHCRGTFQPPAHYNGGPKYPTDFREPFPTMTVTQTEWVCDICNVEAFDSYEEACRHEKECLHRSKKHITSFTLPNTTTTTTTLMEEPIANDNTTRAQPVEQRAGGAISSPDTSARASIDKTIAVAPKLPVFQPFQRNESNTNVPQNETEQKNNNLKINDTPIELEAKEPQQSNHNTTKQIEPSLIQTNVGAEKTLPLKKRGSLAGPETSHLSIIPKATNNLPSIVKTAENQFASPPTKKKDKCRSDGNRWKEMFSALEAYKTKHGTCVISKSHGPNRSLSRWTQYQRQEYKKFQSGKKSSITQDRIDALEKISFEWNPRDASWENRFKELTEYKIKHGDCLVPMRFKENPSLGMWVNNLRIQHRLRLDGEPSLMTAERECALENLGFVWEVKRPSNEKEWFLRQEELREFKKSFGHCDVPHRYQPNQKLGWWVQTQRKQYKLLERGKRSTLTPERVAVLEELGFVWSVPLGRSRGGFKRDVVMTVPK